SLAPFGGRALGGRGPFGGLGRGARGGPALVPAHSTATGGGRVLEGCGPGALDGGEGDRVRGSGLLLVLLLVLVVRGRRARGGDAALGRGGTRVLPGAGLFVSRGRILHRGGTGSRGALPGPAPPGRNQELGRRRGVLRPGNVGDLGQRRGLGLVGLRLLRLLGRLRRGRVADADRRGLGDAEDHGLAGVLGVGRRVRRGCGGPVVGRIHVQPGDDPRGVRIEGHLRLLSRIPPYAGRAGSRCHTIAVPLPHADHHGAPGDP